MNTLFVTFNFSTHSISGGSIISNRNFQSLKECIYIREITTYVIRRKSSHNKVLNALINVYTDIANLSFGGLNNKQKKEIFQIIDEKNINIIFLDSSLFGCIAEDIKNKNSNIKIITYFHNLEYSFISQSIRIDKTFHLSYRILLAYLNEKKSCQYSDYLIAINSRDSKSIEKKYKTKINEIIPVSIEDKYKYCIYDKNTFEPKTGLFVGSNFYANRQGIEWFIENVLPYVSMKLIIVGKGLQKLNLKYKMDSVEIIDYIENLEEIYKKTNFVILPIFSGSGMKVKTAEALMYGKYIIGTDEALEGYIINNDIGIRCNTPNDFIESIKMLPSDIGTFNEESRKLFLKQYSYNATQEIFNRIISSFKK